MTSINSDILKWARISSGTSLEEAEDKFGKEKIKAWEEGADFPTYAQLKSLCNFYRKPVAVFFFPEPPEMKNIQTSCRTLPSQLSYIFSRKLIAILDKARVMQLNLYELNNGQNPFREKLFNIKIDCNDIATAARQLRNTLHAPLEVQKKIKYKSESFEYWRDRFYDLGIYVFKGAFRDSDISGFCLYDDEFPIIYINNSFSFTRQIFTLFHEVFHLLNQTSGIDIFNDKDLMQYLTNKTDAYIERSCNEFSGQFLVPDDDFEIIIKGKIISDKLISDLADIYSVSREVILRKFLNRGAITESEYIDKSQEYIEDYFRNKKSNDKDNHGNYYNNQIAYKGKHYIELAFSQYYSNNITIVQLSRYMDMKISSIQSLAEKKGWGTL